MPLLSVRERESLDRQPRRARAPGRRRALRRERLRDAVAALNGEIARQAARPRRRRSARGRPRALRELDGTPWLERLGANAVLAASVATALAAADGAGLPLWRTLAPDGEPLLPLPMVNVVSGGPRGPTSVEQDRSRGRCGRDRGEWPRTGSMRQSQSDVAATQLFDGRGYRLTSEGRTLRAEELVAELRAGATPSRPCRSRIRWPRTTSRDGRPQAANS